MFWLLFYPPAWLLVPYIALYYGGDVGAFQADQRAREHERWMERRR